MVKLSGEGKYIGDLYQQANLDNHYLPSKEVYILDNQGKLYGLDASNGDYIDTIDHLRIGRH